MLVAEWRRVLLAAKAARAAAYLGPRPAARAAAAELEHSPWEVRIAVACVLASQAAKTEFLADLRTFWRYLEGADAFRVQLQQSARATRATAGRHPSAIGFPSTRRRPSRSSSCSSDTDTSSAAPAASG
jgi:hypothetical protein